MGYEGADVDAFYLGDILRALGCNVTNAAVATHGGAAALGEKRIAFADFGAILTAVKADTSSTGCKEDYVEGLKVFDKDGSGKVLLPEIKNVLSPWERSSRTMMPTSCAFFSESSPMRTTTSDTWSSSTSFSLPPLKSMFTEKYSAKFHGRRIIA